MLVYLVILIILLFSIDYIFNCNDKSRLLNQIPGPRSVFILGDALNIMCSAVNLFSLGRDYAKRYNGIYKFYAFTIGSVNIYNPDDIETIVSSMKFHEKSQVYHLLTPWLKEGLLVSNGSKWQSRRKLLTSAFHFSVLQKYFTTIEENSQLLVESLKETNSASIDLVPVMTEHSLNTICETAMGTKLSESSAGHKYKMALHGLIKIMIYRFTHIYLFPDLTFNLTYGFAQNKYLSVIHGFTNNVIKKRKETLGVNDNQENSSGTSKVKRNAMLDLLITAEKDNLIDSAGIQEEVDTFMFEGHDTTTAGLTFCLLALANEPVVQDKIFKELQSIFGDDNRKATIEDLASMRYLDCCIKESLRMYPPVPFMSRKIKEPVKLSNYTIPEGTFCHIHIYDLHHREDLFKDPKKFDPDRFLPENCVDRHPYAYIPFSAGPRNCIGQKFAMMALKSAISSILRNFKLLPVTKPEDLRFAADIVLRNSAPVYVKCIPRKP